MTGDTDTLHPTCASCDVEKIQRICAAADGTAGKGCPTVLRKNVLAETNREYEDAETREFARQASIQEGECYANRGPTPYVSQPSKTRIQEVCEFAHKMKYRRLGMVFCAGLIQEAARVEEILKIHGFEVVSAVCKAGRVDKREIGIKDGEKIQVGQDEAMCNPIFQAKLLNHEKTEFNIVVGLCVGHDSLFLKYAEAPCTVLVVKDRVTGHNPLAAIFLSDSYYAKLKHPEVLAQQ